jgi:predicted metal-binding protein
MNNNTTVTTNTNSVVSNANMVNTNRQGEGLFVSQDQSIQFEVDNNWKCVEAVYGKRIDCYPKSRQSEEYDAGLDQFIVYMPNITIRNTDCQLSSDKIIDSEPKKIEQEGSGIFYEYYKRYGSCAVTVTTNSEITTNAELESILDS